jgi:hypothetical protein
MISIKMDVSKLTRDLDTLALKQIPYALQLGLNDTALDFQQAEREQISSSFTLRKPQWVLSTVKILRGDFATKQRPIATVSMGKGATPERGKAEGLLAQFEDGGFKESRDPDFPIAIPTDNLRPSFAELVPNAMFPKALRLVERRTPSGSLAPNRHVTRRGVVQLQGKRRTFVLDPKTMHGVSSWAVFQRFGPNRGDIRMLWRYKTRVRIPARLHFYDTARRVVAERFPENFSRGFFKAITTAR